MVIPCNYYFSMTFAMPFADWKDRIFAANPRVSVVAGSGENVAFERSGFSRADSAAYRGWASRMYSLGAEGLYLFNVAYHPWENKREPDLDRKIYSTDLLDRDAVTRGSRRFVRALRDLHGADLQHPAEPPVRSGDVLTVYLPEGDAMGGSANVVVGFDTGDAQEGKVFVWINGTAVQGVRSAFEKGKFGRSRSALSWAVPPSALKGGANAVRLVFPQDVGVTWCELTLE